MPTYQYACTACDERLEVVQKFTDDPLTECPRCAGRLRKVFSPVGVVFKGSGFYRNDSRAAANGSGKPQPAGAASGGSNGESGSTKSDSSSSSSGSSSDTGSTSSSSGSSSSGASSSGSSAAGNSSGNGSAAGSKAPAKTS